MNINVTILFQALAFLVSYIFLRRYFFAPLFATLQRHEAKKYGLQQEIFSWQHKKQMMQEEKKQQWLHIVQTLKSYIPRGAYILAQKDITCTIAAQKKEIVHEHKKEQQEATAYIVEKLSGSSHDSKH